MPIILVKERLFLIEGVAPPDQWDSARSTFFDQAVGHKATA